MYVDSLAPKIPTQSLQLNIFPRSPMPSHSPQKSLNIENSSEFLCSLPTNILRKVFTPLNPFVQQVSSTTLIRAAIIVFNTVAEAFQSNDIVITIFPQALIQTILSFQGISQTSIAQKLAENIMDSIRCIISGKSPNPLTRTRNEDLRTLKLAITHATKTDSLTSSALLVGLPVAWSGFKFILKSTAH